MNFARQPAEQKNQGRPSCRARCAVLAGSTVMPHTGSTAEVASGICPAVAINSFTVDSPAVAAMPRKLRACHIYHTGV